MTKNNFSCCTVCKPYLGLFLVLLYLIYSVLSVAYAAGLNDTKGQFVWLFMPLIFTPPFVYDFFPVIHLNQVPVHYADLIIREGLNKSNISRKMHRNALIYWHRNFPASTYAYLS